MTTFSHQETFNLVAKHLLTQGKKAIGEGAFAYRTEDGLKCAAGCLIPDEQYDPEFEELNVGSLKKELNLVTWFGHDFGIVERLQVIHDTRDVDDWRNELERVAKDFDLSAYVIADYE